MKVLIKNYEYSSNKIKKAKNREYFVIQDNEIFSMDELENALGVYEKLKNSSTSSEFREVRFQSDYFLKLEDDEVLFLMESEYCLKTNKVERVVYFNSKADLSKYSKFIKSRIDCSLKIKNIVFKIDMSIKLDYLKRNNQNKEDIGNLSKNIQLF